MQNVTDQRIRNMIEMFGHGAGTLLGLVAGFAFRDVAPPLARLTVGILVATIFIFLLNREQPRPDAGLFRNSARIGIVMFALMFIAEVIYAAIDDHYRPNRSNEGAPKLISTAFLLFVMAIFSKLWKPKFPWHNGGRVEQLAALFQEPKPNDDGYWDEIAILAKQLTPIQFAGIPNGRDFLSDHLLESKSPATARALARLAAASADPALVPDLKRVQSRFLNQPSLTEEFTRAIRECAKASGPNPIE